MRIVVHEDSFPERAAFDTALTRALLRAVGEGRAPAALRLYRPGEVVAFSLLDRVQPGFREAVAEARAQGFEAVLRLAGGRAAVFTRDTLGFAWCIPDPEPRAAIAARFEELARVVAAALRRLGVDARVGPVSGEYCPGDHSVNARGKVKLMGVGQRVVKGAAHVGGVIVLANAPRVRDVLVPVYARMGFAWHPATVGALEDEIGAISHAAVVEALLAELGKGYEVEHAALPPALLAEAEALAAEHRIGP